MTTSTSKDPDQIRAEIAQTRGELSSDVNALAEHVKPANVAARQVDKVRGAFSGTKDRIMGAAPDLGSAKDSATSSVSGATDRISGAASSAASSAGDAVAATPAVVTARTQGNPLAVGLIAFGVGWLAGSLIPSTAAEQQAAAKAKQNVEPLKEKVTDAAKEVADNLREPAQQAVQSVKQTATEAVENTKSEGTSAAQSVRGDAQDAAGTVQESRS